MSVVLYVTISTAAAGVAFPKTGAFDFLHGVLSASGAAEKSRGNEADAINCSRDQD
jgi:hypothetical protein